MSITPNFFDKGLFNFHHPHQSEFKGFMDPMFQLKPFVSSKINVEMKETDNDFLIHAELPGINKSNIDVNIENNVLTISAEKTETKEENTTKFHISERSFGKITRSVLIPKNVDNENIKASYVDGVLNIVLPKETKSVSKSLKIE
jgi:HSP20 family protein